MTTKTKTMTTTTTTIAKSIVGERREKIYATKVSVAKPMIHDAAMTGETATTATKTTTTTTTTTTRPMATTTAMAASPLSPYCDAIELATTTATVYCVTHDANARYYCYSRRHHHRRHHLRQALLLLCLLAIQCAP
jgi:hypothetical protein